MPVSQSPAKLGWHSLIITTVGNLHLTPRIVVLRSYRALGRRHNFTKISPFFNHDATLSSIVKHSMHLDYQFVHQLFITGSWLVHDLFTKCSQLFHKFFTNCYWFIQDLYWTSSLLLIDQFMTLMTFINVLNICSWLVHNLFTICSWL